MQLWSFLNWFHNFLFIPFVQIVNYIADENGYRPTITYEDTGRGSYNNNAQQQGYDNNAQGFGGY